MRPDTAAEMLHESTKRPSTPVKTQIKYVFSSKYSFPLFAMFLLFNFAAMVFNSIAVYFIRDVLGNALYGIGLAFYGSLLFASTADVADHINLTTKTDVSGLSNSIAQLGMLLGSVGISVILSLGKYDAQAANNGIAQSSVTLFAERCGYAVVPLVCSILLVLISNFMNADEEVIKLRNTQ